MNNFTFFTTLFYCTFTYFINHIQAFILPFQRILYGFDYFVFDYNYLV